MNPIPICYHFLSRVVVFTKGDAIQDVISRFRNNTARHSPRADYKNAAESSVLKINQHISSPNNVVDEMIMHQNVLHPPLNI